MKNSNTPKKSISKEENRIWNISKKKSEELLNLLSNAEFWNIKFVSEMKYKDEYYWVFEYEGKQFLINSQRKIFTGLENGIDRAIFEEHVFGKGYLRYHNWWKEYLIDQEGKSCPWLEQGYSLYDRVEEVEYFKKVYASDIKDGGIDNKAEIDVTWKLEYRWDK